MEKLVKGDVVVIPFPYSDLTNAKRRPALVLAESSYNDLILCQITSQATKDASAIVLSENDFTEGKVFRLSNIRPNKIFTADTGIVLYKIGSLKPEKLEEIITVIVKIFRE
jgi:mRNA interferase MazF